VVVVACSSSARPSGESAIVAHAVPTFGSADGDDPCRRARRRVAVVEVDMLRSYHINPTDIVSYLLWTCEPTKRSAI
jgi:hypothetical protein